MLSQPGQFACEVAVCDLAHIGPVISACAVVIIKPLVKQMVLV